MPCGSQAGPTIDLFGREVVPAHPSRLQGRKGVRSAKRITARQHDYNFSGMVTSLGAQPALTGILDIFGRKCGDSSRSVALQRSLVNRLRVRTDALGSTLFNLTWKLQTTPSHRSICALLASGRLISDSDFSSWPTPMAGSKGTEEYNEAGNTDSGRRTVALVPWPTPQEHDSVGGKTTDQVSKMRKKTGAGVSNLNETVMLTSWSTPNVDEANNATRESGQFKSLTQDAQLTSWATPKAEDAESAGERKSRGVSDTLTSQSRLTGWVSPASRDWKDTPGMATQGTNPDGSKRERVDQLPRQVQQTVIGETPSGSPAKTEATARLNPKFSLWLMGLPVIVWASCGEQVTRSSRRSPKPL